MKKFIYLLPAVAMAFASCSSDEPTAGQQTTYEPGNGFMTFNIVAPVSAGTRADDPVPFPGENNGSGYFEDGTPDESNVKGVRFYFFNEKGQPFGVHKHLTEDVYDSFIDWYPIGEDITSGDPDKTIEESLQAAIELNLEYVDGKLQYPTQVVAIINPTNEILSLGTTTGPLTGPTLSDLLSNVSDYKTGVTSNNFVMSNSVYADIKDKKKFVTTPIEETDIYVTAEDARENPVTIYVERVAARVDFSISTSFTTKTEGPDPQPVGEPIPITKDGESFTIYPLGSFNIYDDPANPTVQDNQTLYVRFLGWNITSVASQSRLIKEINPAWTTLDLFGNLGSTVGPWSTTDFCRSFWAVNPNPTGAQDFEIQYGEFLKGNGTNNYYPAVGNDMPTPGEYTKIYLQENANPYSSALTAASTEEPTKLIVGAQIVDREGNPVTLAEWRSHKYSTKAMLMDMVQTLMTQQPDGGLYYKVTDGGTTTYKPITWQDLEIVNQDPATTTDDINDPSYYVYITLKKSVQDANREWCLGEGKKAFANSQAVINYLREVLGHAMVWTTGQTYYYETIRHLGYVGNGEVEQTNPAAYGIVRNHIYRIMLNSVAGLGCPVFDPKEIIIPEESAPAEAVLSADIKVLQWRVVSQEFDITW